MLRITTRPFSKEERQKLIQAIPSFLFKRRRKLAQQELSEDVADVLELVISRAWDMSGCQPPCCPLAYLFEVNEDQFVYAESWTAFNDRDRFPTRKMEIVRAPRTKRILSVWNEGEELGIEDNSPDPATDCVEANVECEVLAKSELSDELSGMVGDR